MGPDLPVFLVESDRRGLQQYHPCVPAGGQGLFVPHAGLYLPNVGLVFPTGQAPRGPSNFSARAK